MNLVNREEFLNRLEATTPGLKSGQIVTEQTDSFVFQKGWVFTYNDEVSCRIPSKLDKSATGAVPAKKMMDHLRRWNEDEVRVEFDEEKLTVVGKGRRAWFRLEAEITLPTDSVDLPETWVELHKDFPEAVNVVQQCTSKDESRFATTCVHLHPKWIEACDDFQLCRWKLKSGLSEAVLVRGQSIKRIATLGITEMGLTDSWIHFKGNDGLILSCRRYAEVADFPTLTEILKTTGTAVSLPKGLAESATKAADFSVENAAGNMVKVTLAGGKVKLEAVGISGGYREKKNITYDGPDLEFLIPPQLLSDLVKRHGECLISENYLKVDSGAYQYLTVLNKAQENDTPSNDEPIEPKEGEE